MSTAEIDRSDLMAAMEFPPVMTSGAESHAVFADDEANSKQWHRCYERLIDWSAHPGEEDVDGYVSPTTESIKSFSMLLSVVLRKHFASPPSTFAENGDGGIVAEFSFAPSIKLTFEVDDNGAIELRLFVENRLIRSIDICVD